MCKTWLKLTNGNVAEIATLYVRRHRFGIAKIFGGFHYATIGCIDSPNGRTVATYVQYHDDKEEAFANHERVVIELKAGTTLVFPWHVPPDMSSGWFDP